MNNWNKDNLVDLAMKLTLEQARKIEQLEAQIKQLESQVNYWRIEAKCSEDRWIHALEDLDKIRNEMRKQ